jgi:folate-dependent tRNA-U54 methylase TrmFO/GidA
MSPFFDLEKLHKVPGFENARYEDPYAGGQGNSMRYFAMAPRDDALKVIGVDNLFCAGEKAGLLVGHTEAIVTGTLAGYNAARYLAGYESLVLPRELAIGEAIAYVNEQMKTPKGLGLKYTFSGSVFFDRMKELNLYTVDIGEIKRRVQDLGLSGIFNRHDAKIGALQLVSAR